MRRGDNPRLITRGEYWVELSRWFLGESSGPPCTECGDPMCLGPFVGALVCEECAPYVPESERAF